MFQSILTSARFVMWVTFQEDGAADVDAEVVSKPDVAAVKAIIGGLARAARREIERLKLLTLEVGSQGLGEQRQRAGVAGLRPSHCSTDPYA